MADAVTRPLLERFPRLAARFHPLLQLPTPVHRLDAISAQVGGEVWIKRDDRMGAPIGGSKARALEFCLRQFIGAGKTILAYGPYGSNWLANLAWASRAHGFPVEIWTFPQHLNDHARRNMNLLRGLGRDLRHAQGPAEFVTHAIVRAGRLLSSRTHTAPIAGTTPHTIVAHVNAMMELKRQIESGELPMPGRIFVALGSGGTTAGMLAGATLLEMPVQIVAVRVTVLLMSNRTRILSLARRTLALLDPDVRLDASRLKLVGHFCGIYGQPTPEGREARRRFAVTEGIDLDDSYTAKAAAALLATPPSDRPTLFWNTFAPRPIQ